MNSIFSFIILGAGALAAGSILGYLFRQNIAKKRVGTIEAKLEKMLEGAKREAKETVIQAKDKSIKILEEAQKEQKEREQQIMRLGDRLERKEQSLEIKSQDLDKKYIEVAEKAEKVKEIKEQLLQAQAKKMAELERVAKLTQEQAKEELLSQVEKEQGEIFMERIQKLEQAGFIILEKYRGFRLTAKGKGVGKKISNRHQVLYKFLKLLSLPEDVINHDIEGLEHHLSNKTLDALEKLIRNLKKSKKREKKLTSHKYLSDTLNRK